MDDEEKYIYTAVTFAPVQGFIEKSRKLRDLYGASQILSYLSRHIIDTAEREISTIKVISPGSPNIERGIPNRILFKGDFPEDKARESILQTWKKVLNCCKEWLTSNLRHLEPYYWDDEWNHWANHTWEIFWAQADSPISVMKELETKKLCRDWTAINWVGESSSLSGSDAIAFPGLGGTGRNPKHTNYKEENKQIKTFYTDLAKITEEPTSSEIQGKFIDPREKLSIPELTKRLVTYPSIAEELGMSVVERFTEIQRQSNFNGKTEYLWTGWFMGDGDNVGEHLKNIAEDEGDVGLSRFSTAMQKWGEDFYEDFNRYPNPNIQGRVIYAGGDDFLGVIYGRQTEKKTSDSKQTDKKIGLEVYEWLMTLNDRWNEHKQKITLSVGFVWAAGGVPQRDVLQHCRETQKIAKSSGKDRVTIRVVFNSGQYVQWTCPWNYLYVLKRYRDRDGKTYPKWECRGRKDNCKPNWNHIYSDLAELKARHAIDLHKSSQDRSKYLLGMSLFDIYFEDERHLQRESATILYGERNTLVKDIDMIIWINDLINVGWQICTNI